MLVGPENKTEINSTAEAEAASRPRLGRVLGTAALLGAAALLAGELRTAETMNPRNPIILESAEARVISANSPARGQENADRNKNCTSIRTNANYIYTGYACAEDGDSYTRVPGVPLKQGWAYAVVRIAMNGTDIAKCGYVRPSVLPVRPPRPRSVTHCRNYFSSLVLKNSVFFTDYNCENVSPAFDKCKDGTYHSPVSAQCPNPVTYRNFESDNPSPTNVFGTGQGGFRDAIKDNKKTSVRYRTEFVKPTSSGTKAIVVRAPKWGLANARCVSDKHRDGGTVK